MKQQFLWMGLVALVFTISIRADDPATPPRPGGDRDRSRHPAVRMLDGDWKVEREGQREREGDRGLDIVYDISDVEISDDRRIAQFDVAKKIEMRRGDRERILCQGTGSFEFERKLMVFSLLCPIRDPQLDKDYRQLTQVVLKLEFNGAFRGGRIDLEGKRQEQYVGVVGDKATIGQPGPVVDIKLIKERDREGGFRWRRFPGGGGRPGPGPGPGR